MKPFFLPCSLWVVLLGGTTALAQHAHINAGALSTGQNARLSFINGAGFVTNSGYLANLVYTNGGQYSNYFHGSISFTSLPATGNNGGPAFGHAAPGSYLQLQVVSVAGPADGSFGFWEEQDAMPRFNVTVGSLDGTNLFNLSEGDGSPGSDPYGHVHGRRFTASKPGLYTVDFRILDTSTNGEGGGPIHTASDLFQLYFQAGFTIASLTKETNTAAVVFGAQPGTTFYLETTPTLGNTSLWSTVDGPLTGTNRLQTLIDTNAADAARFYRIRATTP